MAYAPVNGLQLYYEIHGSGRPLVLLHGGLMTIDLNFGPLLEPLAAGRFPRSLQRLIDGAFQAGFGRKRGRTVGRKAGRGSIRIRPSRSSGTRFVLGVQEPGPGN